MDTKSILEAHPLVKERFKRWITEFHYPFDILNDRRDHIIKGAIQREWNVFEQHTFEAQLGYLISFAISEGYWIWVVPNTNDEKNYSWGIEIAHDKPLMQSTEPSYEEAYLSAFEAFCEILETKLKEDE